MSKDGWLYRQDEIYNYLEYKQTKVLSVENLQSYLIAIKTIINKKITSNLAKLRLINHIDRIFVRAIHQLRTTLTVINETNDQTSNGTNDCLLLQVLYDVFYEQTTKWPIAILLALIKKKSIKIYAPLIDDLNDHCLLTIFRHFNFNELVPLAKISSKWHRIAQMAVGQKLIILDYQLHDKVIRWLRYDSQVSALILEKPGNFVKQIFRKFRPTTAQKAINSSFFKHSISNITQLSISIRTNFEYFDKLSEIVMQCREQLTSLSIWFYKDHKIDGFFRLHYPKLRYFCALGNLSVAGILTQFCQQNSHLKEINLALFHLDAADFMAIKYLQNLRKIRFRLKIFADDAHGTESGFIAADDRSMAYNYLYNALVDIETLKYLDIRWSNWHNDAMTNIKQITHFMVPHFTELNLNIFHNLFILHNGLLSIANNMINLRVVCLLYEIPGDILLKFVNSCRNLETLYLSNGFKLTDDLYLSLVDVYRKRRIRLHIILYGVRPVVGVIIKESHANVSADLLLNCSRIVSLTETRPFDINDKVLYPFNDEVLYPYDPIIDT